MQMWGNDVMGDEICVYPAAKNTRSFAALINEFSQRERGFGRTRQILVALCSDHFMIAMDQDHVRESHDTSGDIIEVNEPARSSRYHHLASIVQATQLLDGSKIDMRSTSSVATGLTGKMVWCPPA